MKLNVVLGSAAIGLFAAAAQAGVITTTANGDLGGNVTGSLDIEERMQRGTGIYNVMNNTNGGLYGFGVSNDFSIAAIFNDDGLASNFGCVGSFCYEARTLTSFDWDNIAYSVFGDGEEQFYTFQDLFGDFSVASGGDNTFHWYTEVDGNLGAGEAQDDFFGFFSVDVASSIIGIATSSTGATAFTAGQAVPPSAVPLPAGGLLLLAGLGGLGAASRRRKA